MSRVKTTSGSSKIQKPVPTQWKDRLQEQDYQELKTTFDLFDEDGSGTIDPIEINKVLQELGLTSRSPIIFGILMAIKQQQKPLKFEEFVDVVGSKIGETRTTDGLKRVFALWDPQGTGFIDFDKFKDVARSIGESMNDEDILEMMHSTFINHKTSSNQTFTFEEFEMIINRFNQKRGQ